MVFKIFRLFSTLFLCAVLFTYGQSGKSDYWQQHVDYKMEIDMDVKTYQYRGKQELIYTNNSPDTLDRVFYHLYFNAFQPGSEMDLHVQNLPDPDGRMVNNIGSRENPVFQSRISTLKPNEIGYIKVNALTQDGKAVVHVTEGTILEVELSEPILPGQKSTFNMDYDAQVPVQIRRNGRNNKEGVALSMAQWYPKLAEYDEDGWHVDPYIQREFYGVWGNFDVKITIDKNYIIGGTGYLQNPNEIGHGYQTTAVKSPSGEKLTWHFIAPDVHDFTWAADPDYLHDVVRVDEGFEIHFLYQNDPKIIDNWKRAQPKTVELFKYFISEIGPYPYKQYSIIQGGDGGMEYPMCTLITGARSFGALMSVISHEVAHSWFHGVVANNEAVYPWMDEGFAQYFDTLADYKIEGENPEHPFSVAYRAYFRVVNYGIENPMSTHSDRHDYNASYSVASYYKGLILLNQLQYIIGADSFRKTIHDYYKKWSFKHPKPEDFIRVAEKSSGINLDWYLKDWTQTTNTIDYGIKSVAGNGPNTIVELERIGLMPMPLDVEVEFNNGEKQQFYIPLRMMRGKKPGKNRVDLSSWPWAGANYSFTIDKSLEDINSITIDPKLMMADINRDNNSFKN